MDLQNATMKKLIKNLTYSCRLVELEKKNLTKEELDLLKKIKDLLEIKS